jgi:hypothetical protein
MTKIIEDTQDKKKKQRISSFSREVYYFFIYWATEDKNKTRDSLLNVFYANKNSNLYTHKKHKMN